jgi:hypothetical protein
MTDQKVVVAAEGVEDEELVCDMCGWELSVLDNPICESCYSDKATIGDVVKFADELNQLGDQIRDNRGDRERWWNTARDLAAELRAWGHGDAAA